MARTKSIPSNEVLWVTIINGDGNNYYITSDQYRNYYYIYDFEYNKLGKNVDPIALEKKYVKRKECSK